MQSFAAELAAVNKENAKTMLTYTSPEGKTMIAKDVNKDITDTIKALQSGKEKIDNASKHVTEAFENSYIEQSAAIRKQDIAKIIKEEGDKVNTAFKTYEKIDKTKT